ncbi:hypothetical protein [Ornithobacterium rhinotracheale]|uniref:hypothetical protein n=1 Tax=Ornithobacterium rhinotracheale TaxID=28251 RepID=UPI0040369383
MKNLFLLVLAFSFSAIFGQQKLEGTYTGSTLIGSEKFTFFKNGIFIDRNPVCGKGHYSIKNDTLILNYNLTEFGPVPYHFTHRLETYTDSPILKIKVFDKDKKPCYRCFVDVYKDSNTLSPIEKNIKFTDKNGEVFFKIPSPGFSSGRIRILQEEDEGTMAGETYEFPLNMTNSNEIEVFLTGIQYYQRCIPIKYTIIKRKIKKIDKDELVLDFGVIDLKLEKKK